MKTNLNSMLPFLAFIVLVLLNRIAIADTPGHTAGHTFYSDPIQYGDYVHDPRALILEGMNTFHWVAQEDKPGVLLAKLEHDGDKVLVEIHYDNGKIWFVDSSTTASSCQGVAAKATPNQCDVSERSLTRWRFNLRRGILKAIKPVAVADAQAKFDAASLSQSSSGQPNSSKRKSKRRPARAKTKEEEDDDDDKLDDKTDERADEKF